MRKLLVATTNPGKLREYRHMLQGLPVEVVTLEKAGITQDIEETGATIRDNAILKAEAYAALSGMLTLADDSGLEVDALDGEPGPKSARYAGEHASTEERNALLLRNMEAVPDERRQARFRCVIAIAEPGGGEARTTEGTCEGLIAHDQRGATGFGYDPLFIVAEPGDPAHGRRMAELAMDEKNAISHRGRAMAGALHIPEGLVASRTGSA